MSAVGPTTAPRLCTVRRTVASERTKLAGPVSPWSPAAVTVGRYLVVGVDTRVVVVDGRVVVVDARVVVVDA